MGSFFRFGRPTFNQSLWLGDQRPASEYVAFGETVINLPAPHVRSSAPLFINLSYEGLRCLSELIEKALRRIDGHFLNIRVKNRI